MVSLIKHRLSRLHYVAELTALTAAALLLFCHWNHFLSNSYGDFMLEIRELIVIESKVSKVEVVEIINFVVDV